MNDSNSITINFSPDYESNCLPKFSRNEGPYKVSDSFERCPVHSGDDDLEEPVIKEDEWQQ